MKQDIYGHEKRYKSWKDHVLKSGEDNLTKKNSDLMIKYIFDMEQGNNVSTKSKKGARCYHRLNALRQKVSKIFRLLQERKIKDVSKLTDKQIQSLFNDMRKGVILSGRGKRYESTSDYVKAFKSFWHWFMKVNAKQNKLIPDITEYVDSSAEKKPKWVYLDEQQIATLLKKCSPHYAPLIEFLYCSGSRVTEAFSLVGRNIEVKNNIVFIHIPDEVAKSSGRKIKLLLCGKNMLQYMKENNIKDEDLLFPLSAPYVNRYLSNLSKELFGEGISKAGEKYSKLTMYDLRHNSCCYWLPRYKTNSALMYKFGWKSEKYIHYYSEFLGMKDPIKDEDLYVDITKTELEREIEKLKRNYEALAKGLLKIASGKNFNDKYKIVEIKNDIPTT